MGRGAGTRMRPCSSLPGQLDSLLSERPPKTLESSKPRASEACLHMVAASAQGPMQGPTCTTPTQQQPSFGGAGIFDMDLGTPGAAEGAADKAQNQQLSLFSMDRSLSDLEHYKAIKAACGMSVFDQLIQLCCPTTDIELAVAEHLRRVRGQPRATYLDTEDLAAELLAMGLLVQVRRGEGASEGAARNNPRDCLRTLRHTFIVCTGYQRGSHGDTVFFKEPLVVEPRFKEQFLIAHPTRTYEELLQVLPISFVGSARRLEAAVRLLADQMAQAFKQDGRSVPPWRSADAMLSKWAPAQLSELSKLMRAFAMAQQQQQLHQAAVAATVLYSPPGAADAAARQQQQSAFASMAAKVLAPPPLAAEARPEGGPAGVLQPNSANSTTSTGLQPASPAATALAKQPVTQALDMVRSMSRQMSSTGLSAHSLPGTHADMRRQESLRKSLCGIQALGMPTTPRQSQERTRTATGTDAAQGGNVHPMVQARAHGGSRLGLCAQQGMRETAPTASETAADKVAAVEAQSSGELQKWADGAVSDLKVALSMQRQDSGRSTACALTPDMLTAIAGMVAAVGQTAELGTIERVGPPSATSLVATDVAEPLVQPDVASSPFVSHSYTIEQVQVPQVSAQQQGSQTNRQASAQGSFKAVDLNQQHTLAALHAVHAAAGTPSLVRPGTAAFPPTAVAAGMMTAGPVPVQALNQSETPFQQAPPSPPLFVRQSSSDLKLALKKERSRTRSALAAALKRAAPNGGHPVPSSSVTNSSTVRGVMAPSIQTHMGARQGLQHALAPLPGVPTMPGPAPTTLNFAQQQPAAAAVRTLYEEVWPPRITKVKWGAAGVGP